MNTLAEILASAAGDRTRLQPHMFGSEPLPPELPPDSDPQVLALMRSLAPDPATQWMQNRPAIRPPPPTPPGEGNLTTMQRRFAY